MEGSQAIQKHTNSKKRLLYRLLRGGLVLGLITHYKIPKRMDLLPPSRILKSEVVLLPAPSPALIGQNSEMKLDY